jgi:hypothetical protein
MLFLGRPNNRSRDFFSDPILQKRLPGLVCAGSIQEFGSKPINTCYLGLNAMDIVNERQRSSPASSWNVQRNWAYAAISLDDGFIRSGFAASLAARPGQASLRKRPFLRSSPPTKRMN